MNRERDLRKKGKEIKKGKPSKMIRKRNQTKKKI